MQLTITRHTFTDRSTIGSMSVDGIHFCYTLEPPVKTDGSKPRAIPEGTYSITTYPSPRVRRVVLLLHDVPGFDMVEIHNGNFPKDTHACILVGAALPSIPDEIDRSMPALTELVSRVTTASGCSVTIQGAPAATETPSNENLEDVSDDGK